MSKKISEPVEPGAVVVDVAGRTFVRFDPNPRSIWAWVSSAGGVTSWKYMLEPRLLRSGVKMEPPPEPVRTHSIVKDRSGNLFTKYNDGYWHSQYTMQNWESLEHPVIIISNGEK